MKDKSQMPNAQQNNISNKDTSTQDQVNIITKWKQRIQQNNEDSGIDENARDRDKEREDERLVRPRREDLPEQRLLGRVPVELHADQQVPPGVRRWVQNSFLSTPPLLHQIHGIPGPPARNASPSEMPES